MQLSALVTSPPVGRPILRVVKAGSVSREAVRKVQPSFCVADVPVSNWIARVAEAEARARVRWSTCSRPRLRGTPDPRLVRATWSSSRRAVFFLVPRGGPGGLPRGRPPPGHAGGFPLRGQGGGRPCGNPPGPRGGPGGLACGRPPPCRAGACSLRGRVGRRPLGSPRLGPGNYPNDRSQQLLIFCSIAKGIRDARPHRALSARKAQVARAHVRPPCARALQRMEPCA